MAQSSQEHEIDKVEWAEPLDDEIDELQPTKAPRDHRTIRGELCVPCLELMLSTDNITCLRDSNCDACRLCRESKRKCRKVSHITRPNVDIILMV
jgi:hypothetical protein